MNTIVKNRIDTSNAGDGKLIDTRNVKSSADGLKVRLHGDKVMGYSYFQKMKKEDGSEGVQVIRSMGMPKMENQTDGFQGAVQKPSTCLYSVAWDYNQEQAVLMTVDKGTIIDALFAVEDSSDFGSMNDYDFKIRFHKNEAPAKKYNVARLEKTELTKDQIKELEAFAKGVDLEKFASGEKIEFDKVEEVEKVEQEEVPF